MALCRRTRQVVAYALGDRSQESAFFLHEAIPKTTPDAPPAVTIGTRTPSLFLAEPTAAAEKRRARPTTLNAGLARYERV